MKCLVCGSGKINYFALKKTYKIFKCKVCMLVFVWPLPESTKELYSFDYFSGAKNGYGYVDYETDKQAMISTLQYYLKKLEKLCVQNKKRLLDVGTATGFFLELAQKNKWQAAGIELSEWAANQGIKKGLDIKRGVLENANFPKNNFNAITFIDVIEHFSNPEKELKLAHHVLDVNGLLLINTPDTASVYAKIMGSNWHSIKPPEHLIYFNKSNLSTLLKKTGFEIVSWERVSKKFTFQYCIQISASWLENKILQKLAAKLKNNFWGKIKIPINLKDNILIIAQKTHEN